MGRKRLSAAVVIIGSIGLAGAAGCSGDDGGGDPAASYLEVNGTRYAYGPTEVQCRSISPLYWVQLTRARNAELIASQVYINTTDGTPPAAGSYPLLPQRPPAPGQVWLAIAEHEFSGTVTAQSGTLTVSYVANRPQFDVVDAPGLNDVDGLTSPLGGHFACP